MTEMPQEDMEDASTPEGDHRAEDKRSLRTFAYTASAVVLLVSVFVLVSLLLADLQDLREELAMEMAEVTPWPGPATWPAPTWWGRPSPASPRPPTAGVR